MGVGKVVIWALTILFGLAIIGTFPMAAIVVTAIGIVSLFLVFGRDEY